MLNQVNNQKAGERERLGTKEWLLSRSFSLKLKSPLEWLPEILVCVVRSEKNSYRNPGMCCVCVQHTPNTASWMPYRFFGEKEEKTEEKNWFL